MSYTFSFTDTSNTQCAESAPRKATQLSYILRCKLLISLSSISSPAGSCSICISTYLAPPSHLIFSFYIVQVYFIIFALYQRYQVSCKVCLFHLFVIFVDLVFSRFLSTRTLLSTLSSISLSTGFSM